MKLGIKIGLLGIVSILTIQSHVLAGGTVTSCDEASLRAALAGGGTVTFACDGTIALANTLVITNNTVLDASGHSITLSGGNAVRLFYVAPGVTFCATNLTLANGSCIVTSGTVGTPADAGAIYNDGGTVTLVACTLMNNSAQSLIAGGLARGGAIFNSGGTVSLFQSAISNNAAMGGYPNGYGTALGGAFFNTNGSVTITSCNVSSNFCEGFTPFGTGLTMGGAAFQASGSLTIANSIFSLNLGLGGAGYFSFSTGPNLGSPAYGGALAATGGTVTIDHSQFFVNTASGGTAGYHGAGGPAFGGAVYSAATLTVRDSSFFGNQSLAGNNTVVPTSGSRGVDGFGGAIYNSGTAVLNRCSVYSNYSQGGSAQYFNVGYVPVNGGNGLGGGIFNASQFAATNCTIAINTAVGGSGEYGYSGNTMGGGVFNNTNAMFIAMNLTIASNSCSSPSSLYYTNGIAAGTQIANTNGTLRLHNSIIAYGDTNGNACGTITDDGYNICSDGTAQLFSGSSYNFTDPKLGPLDDYGGSTPTMVLLAGSPAIDGGDNVTFPPTDQRGHARPYGAAADIGAFESSPPFFIGGQVSGQTLRDEVTIVIGSSNLVTTNLGTYGVSAFAAGFYTVTPTSPDYLFIPANCPLTVGPDQLGVNFKAYRWNTLSLESCMNGVLHCVIADTNGQTCRVLTSTDLIQWLPISTNTLGPSNYFETFFPITDEPRRYFRTVIP